MIRRLIVLVLMIAMTVVSLEYRSYLWAACSAQNGNDVLVASCTCVVDNGAVPPEREEIECHQEGSALTVVSYQSGSDCGVIIDLQWLCRIDLSEGGTEKKKATLWYSAEDQTDEVVCGCDGEEIVDLDPNCTDECSGPWFFGGGPGFAYDPPVSCYDYELQLVLDDECDTCSAEQILRMVAIDCYN